MGVGNERLKVRTDGSTRLAYTVRVLHWIEWRLFLRVFSFSRIKKGEGQEKENVTLKL